MVFEVPSDPNHSMILLFYYRKGYEGKVPVYEAFLVRVTQCFIASVTKSFPVYEVHSLVLA